MKDPYGGWTPSTEDVERLLAEDHAPSDVPSVKAAFRRWLARHEGEIGAAVWARARREETLDESYKVIRLSEDLTRALNDFLGAHIPEYNTVDDVFLQVETTEAGQDELYVPETTRRYFLVDHDAAVDGPTPINDPKESA